MGFRSVGKTSLTTQFVENQFNDSYDPTIENTFRKTIKVSGQEYQLELIDTAGQDELSMVSQNHCMNLDGYVLVYSVTSEKSFEIVKNIYTRLQDVTGKKFFPVVLVGNKTDLKSSRIISYEEGRRLADEWQAVFVEASAKQNEKVADIFSLIVDKIERSQNFEDPNKGGCICS
jgi:Ras family protein